MNRIVRYAFALLILASCKRDLSYVGTGDPTPLIPEPITARLTGTVLDENGQPMGGATVTVGGTAVTTNALGYFRLNSAALDKSNSTVKVERTGYFTGYRVFSATEATNNVVVKLIRKTAAGTVNGTTGGDVTLSNGARITLPANGVVTASNHAAYTGTVTVYAAYIDPTANDIMQTVPGSFLATDKNGARVTLASYGMLAVELQGASGEKLQVKQGSTATLVTPIPSSLQASAPSMIALWSVDETNGIWKEEGMATRQGGSYVGGVKHFSFWNCDVSANAIRLTVTVKNTDGQPMVHTLVRITRAANNFATYGYTDSLGKVSGYVPGNELLSLAVLGGPCQNVLYAQNIGPFSQNTDLGVITINSTPPTGLVTVKGKVLTCAGTPAIAAYAIVTLGYQVHYAPTNANGEFTTNFAYCGQPTSVKVAGLDSLGQQVGNTDSFALVLPVTNVGNISACGNQLQEFVTYTVDNQTFSLNPQLGDSVLAYQQTTSATTVNFILTGQRMGTSNRINLRSENANSTGTFPVNQFTVNQYTTTMIQQPFNVVISTFAPVAGQFYQGSFSGQFRDTQNQLHTVGGTFRLRRAF